MGSGTFPRCNFLKGSCEAIIEEKKILYILNSMKEGWDKNVTKNYFVTLASGPDGLVSQLKFRVLVTESKILRAQS